MWASQPNWTDDQLKAIKTPVLVMDGDHDEAIKRAHTEYMAATIPGAGLDDSAERRVTSRFCRIRRSSTSRCCISSATSKRRGGVRGA